MEPQRIDVLHLVRENYTRLSNHHRTLADYILNNPEESAFYTINQLSQKTDISPATITRFVKTLGFKGYPEFQQVLFDNTQSSSGTLSTLKHSHNVEGMTDEEQGETEDALLKVMEENVHLMEELLQPQMRRAIYKSAEMLRKAEKIYIVGNGSSYAISFITGFLLSRMYNKVQLLDRASDVTHFTAVSEAGEKDCLIAVGYSRYTKNTYDTVMFFKKKKCSIIAITDSASSPIALEADEVLIAPRDTYFSPVSATALCSCIIAALAEQDGQLLERAEQQDQIAEAYGVYL